MHSQIQNLLDTIPVAGFATVSQEGSPWSTALHFTHDGAYLYWFSSTEAVHSLNLARNPQLSVVIWSPDESRGLYGVYIQTRGEPLEDLQVAKALYTQKFGAFPASFATHAGYRAPIGEIDTSKSMDLLWYLKNK